MSIGETETLSKNYLTSTDFGNVCQRKRFRAPDEWELFGRPYGDDRKQSLRRTSVSSGNPLSGFWVGGPMMLAIPASNNRLVALGEEHWPESTTDGP
jgi:hypothetical protein